MLFSLKVCFNFATQTPSVYMLCFLFLSLLFSFVSIFRTPYCSRFFIFCLPNNVDFYLRFLLLFGKKYFFVVFFWTTFFALLVVTLLVAAFVLRLNLGNLQGFSTDNLRAFSLTDVYVFPSAASHVFLGYLFAKQKYSICCYRLWWMT